MTLIGFDIAKSVIQSAEITRFWMSWQVATKKLTTKDEILHTRRLLQAWGRDNFRDYPWRSVDDPWLALVAEVLLQRTNAAHVVKYWPTISARFPTPESVLRSTTSDLEVFNDQFGLDRRARTILELAQYLDRCEYYPDDLEQLISVYGICHYTASAYLSLHMNVRAVLLDSNVARWLCRLFGVDRPKDLRRKSKLWDLAEQLTPKRGFREYNYAVLDFTMQVCKPKNPKCLACPFSEFCKAFLADGN